MANHYRSLADKVIPEIADFVVINAEDWEIRDVVSKCMPEHILMTERGSAARYRDGCLVLSSRTKPQKNLTQPGMCGNNRGSPNPLPR